MKDNKIYVFINGKSYYFNRTFEYCGTYAICKNANWDDLIDHITKEMNEIFKEELDGTYQLPRATITCMNEISKELYERLHQEN